MVRHLWWVLGLALVAAGVAVLLSTQASSSEFGWFAYTPLPDDADWQMGWADPRSSGSVMAVSRGQVAGLAVTTVGLVVLAGGVGFRLGRRRNAPDPS